MSRWIFALALVSAMPFAHAEDVAAKVEDLGGTVEAEEMNVFDQQQLDEQAKKETRDLEEQAKALQGKISSMQSESKTLSKRIEGQTDRYQKMAKLQRESETLATKFKSQRDGLKHKLDSLKARTEQTESRTRTAQELKRSLGESVASANRESLELMRRQKSAQARLDRATREIKTLRVRQQSLAQNNRRLQQRVSATELRAGQNHAPRQTIAGDLD